MAAPYEKLAQSLSLLKGLHDAEHVAIRTNDLSRIHTISSSALIDQK